MRRACASSAARASASSPSTSKVPRGAWIFGLTRAESMNADSAASAPELPDVRGAERAVARRARQYSDAGLAVAAAEQDRAVWRAVHPRLYPRPRRRLGAGAPRKRLPRAPRAAAQVAGIPQPVHKGLPLRRDMREIAAADHVGGVAAGRATEAGVAAQRHEAMCATLAVDEAQRRAGRGQRRPAAADRAARRVGVRRAGARRQRQCRDDHANPGGPAACLRRAPSEARFTAALLQAPLRVALGSACRPQDAQGEGEKEKPDGTYQQDRAHAGALPSAAPSCRVVSSPDLFPRRRLLPNVARLRTLSQMVQNATRHD